jgi:hypothetical protein
MSELKVNKVTPRSGTTVTLGDSGDSVAIPTGVGFNGFNHRNIVINGDMQIAQRSTSVSSITSSGIRTIDRMGLGLVGLGTWTQSQSTDVPTGEGFAKSLKLDCTTADASPAASDLMFFEHRFEGQNLQYLKKGTANASSLTLSFWVKSTKTGTFIVELLDIDNSRTISKSYTVIASDTWEKKTITFEGDTTGAFDNDNARSFDLRLWLGAGTDFTSGALNTTWNSSVNANKAVGQVNIADSDSNDWYITGVQLEAGTTASDFEFLPIDVSLGRCKRYFEECANTGVSNAHIVNGYMKLGTQARTVLRFEVEKRATPSMSSQSTNIIIEFLDGTNTTTTFDFVDPSKRSVSIFKNSAGNVTSGSGCIFLESSTKIQANSEL